MRYSTEHDKAFFSFVFCSESPGHLWILTQQQEKGLGVDEQTPTGQTEDQEDQDTPLQDDANTAQVLPTEGLRRTWDQNSDTSNLFCIPECVIWYQI